VALFHGDVLLAFTVGATEGRAAGGEMFSEDRLRALFVGVPPPGADEALDRVETALQRHTEGEAASGRRDPARLAPRRLPPRPR